MTLACAWCKKIIRQGDTTLPVSHGICETCQRKLLAAELVVDQAVTGHGRN